MGAVAGSIARIGAAAKAENQKDPNPNEVRIFPISCEIAWSG